MGKKKKEKKRKAEREAAKRAAAKKTKGKKYLYFFGAGHADGNGDMKGLLGGKGAGLAEMTNAGIPVPPGFTITTEVCMLFYKSGKKVPAAIDADMMNYVKRLEATENKKFGDEVNHENLRKQLNELKGKLRVAGHEAEALIRALPERGRFSLDLPPTAIQVRN